MDRGKRTHRLISNVTRGLFSIQTTVELLAESIRDIRNVFPLKAEANAAAMIIGMLQSASREGVVRALALSLPEIML